MKPILCISPHDIGGMCEIFYSGISHPARHLQTVVFAFSVDVANC